MNHRLLPLVVFALLLALALPLAAAPITSPASAQGNDWHVESATSLDSTGYPLNRITTGPDGRHFAVQEADSLCVVEMPTIDETCVALPPEAHLNAPPRELFGPFGWSPDASQLAIVGAPFVYLYDTDLTVMNAADGSLVTLADDGVEGSFGINSVPNLIVDSSPAWSPDGTQIAVERTAANAAGEIKRSYVTLVDAATGDAQQVTGLPGYAAGDRDLGTVVSFAWSPDSGTLLFSTRHARAEPLADGLWRVDLESGEPELVLSLATALEPYREIFPEAQEVFVIAPVMWSPDGARLLLWMGNPGTMPSSTWAFWMDVESGAIHPLAQPVEVAGDNPDLLYPTFATWSPDGAQILVAWRTLQEPMEDVGPSLYEGDTSIDVILELLDVGMGDSTLLGYLPLVPAYRYAASWGEDGDVLIAGFYLTLAEG
ncbi:TolB family protein [Aggregatilinea lenta]|uniref:TolB family protein n=1 Tax=Aggregatilinea lenta TaxID=913108 RepID=UPI000E5A4CF8|nr:PD40 domain-containing protein [Aggregatilinea lenta]